MLMAECNDKAFQARINKLNLSRDSIISLMTLLATLGFACFSFSYHQCYLGHIYNTFLKLKFRFCRLRNVKSSWCIIDLSHISQNAPVPYPTIYRLVVEVCIHVHTCAHFCYKVVHGGMFGWCIVGFVRWLCLLVGSQWGSGCFQLGCLANSCTCDKPTLTTNLLSHWSTVQPIIYQVFAPGIWLVMFLVVLCVPCIFTAGIMK